MSNPLSNPRPSGGFGMHTGQLDTAADQVEQLLDMLAQLHPDQLRPDNDKAIGHPELARAVRESASAWDRALTTITADLRRISEHLTQTGTTTARVDQNYARELSHTAEVARTDPRDPASQATDRLSGTSEPDGGQQG